MPASLLVKDMHLKHNLDLLTNRILAGERAAAEELVDKYYEQIYLFFRRMGHSPANSEDLTQECFLQVWQHIGQLKYGPALGSWIYSIAGNVSSNYWRKLKREVIPDGDLEKSNPEQQSAGLAEQAEELDRLKEKVVLLPFKLRQVIVLHYMQQLSIAQAADAIGVRRGTIKSRINRALRILKKKMT